MRNPDGACAFESIKQQRRYAQSLCSRARHIRRADIAAAGEADVLTAKSFYQDIAEGNRSEEVSYDDDDGIKKHLAISRWPLALMSSSWLLLDLISLRPLRSLR